MERLAMKINPFYAARFCCYRRSYVGLSGKYIQVGLGRKKGGEFEESFWENLEYPSSVVWLYMINMRKVLFYRQPVQI